MQYCTRVLVPARCNVMFLLCVQPASCASCRSYSNFSMIVRAAVLCAQLPEWVKMWAQREGIPLNFKPDWMAQGQPMQAEQQHCETAYAPQPQQPNREQEECTNGPSCAQQVLGATPHHHGAEHGHTTGPQAGHTLCPQPGHTMEPHPGHTLGLQPAAGCTSRIPEPDRKGQPSQGTDQPSPPYSVGANGVCYKDRFWEAHWQYRTAGKWPGTQVRSKPGSTYQASLKITLGPLYLCCSAALQVAC